MIELLVTVRAVTCQAEGWTMLGSLRSLCSQPLLRASRLNGVSLIDGGPEQLPVQARSEKMSNKGTGMYQETTPVFLNGVVLYKVISCSLRGVFKCSFLARTQGQTEQPY